MIFEHVFNPKAYKNRAIKEKFIIMQGSQGNLVPFSAADMKTLLIYAEKG